MQLGMTLPVMEPDLWERPDTLERWARAVDAGPVRVAVLRRAAGLRQPGDADPARRGVGLDDAGPAGDHGDRPAAARAGAAGQGAGHRGPAVRRPAHRRARGRRAGRGLPGRLVLRSADHGRDGVARGRHEAGLGRREGDRGDASGGSSAAAAGRAVVAGRDHGAAHGAQCRRVGGRAGRVLPGPGRGRRPVRCTRSPGRRGRRPVAAYPTSRPRSGSRSPTRPPPYRTRGPRCTGTCGTT